MKIELTSSMLEAITAARPAGVRDAADGPAPAGAGFGATMKHAVEQIDGQQYAAEQKVAAVDSGQSDDLIGAMLSSQEASLSFSMMMQVRNKLMSAFDDIIKMQV